MGPPAHMHPGHNAGVVAPEGCTHSIGGRLDGQKDHPPASHGARARTRCGHRSAQASPVGHDGDHPGRVHRARFQLHGERPLSEEGTGGLTPLDQNHATLLHQLPEVEVDHLVEAVQAVDIGVHEGTEARPIRHRVLPDQREGGAGDGAGDPQPGAEPLGEHRLAGAQVTDQQDHVTGTAQIGQGRSQGPGLVGRSGGQAQHPPVGRQSPSGCPRHRSRLGRPCHEDRPMPCLARTRSARISASSTPPERRAAAGW